MPDEDEERPPKRPLLILSVFGICLSGFVLQLLTFIYLFGELCKKVPEGQSYCNTSNNSLNRNNETADPEGETHHFGFYQYLVGNAIFLDLFAVISASCRMYCCVKNCWIHISISTWESCHCCGHCWYIMAGLSVFLNLIGIIAACMEVPFSDLIEYVDGFRFGFANLLFGLIKMTLWIAYSKYRGSCCPNTGYFLGSSRRLSEFSIITTTITTRVTETRTPGGAVQVVAQEVDRTVATRRADP